MTKKSQRSNNDLDLRKRAEEKIRSDSADIQETLLPEETRRMLHELRVHQVELEMQNEELHKSRKELEDSQQRYFVQHEIAPVGFFTLNEKGIILEANLTAATMLGVKRMDLVSKQLSSFILSEDRDIYYIYNKKLFKTGTRQICEFRLVKKDGTPLFAQLEATVALDDDGASVCCAVMSDITERKLSEEALRESEGRYQLLFEGSRDGIVRVDNKGHFLDANRAYCDMLGYNLEELRAMKDFYRITSVPLSDLEHEEIWNNRLLKHGYTDVYEKEYIQKGGTVFPVEVQAFAIFNENKELLYVWGTARNITERKRNEDALHKLKIAMEQSMDGIAFADMDGYIQFVNEAWARMHGYSVHELIGKHLGIFHTAEQLEKEVIPFNEQIIKIGSYECEIGHVRKNGTIFPTLMNSTVVKYADQKATGLLAITRDITEQKRLNEELVQAKKFETMSTFSAGIAHDFNNLLAGVLNYIALSKDDINKPENAFRFLDEAEKIIFKAKDVTNEFLTLSGAAIEYKNTTEPCKLIKEITLPALKDSTIKCEFTLPEDTGEVKIAPELLSQIISNIVENSREAMPDGGIVKIKAEHITRKEEESKLPLKDGMYLFICISDNGCGISKNNLPKIFDPYYSTKQRGVQKGMGLGLAVVYSIVTRLNGYIRIESKEDVGTDVFIYLPSTVKPAVGDEKKQETKVQEIKVEVKAAAGTKKILFMDDEESLRTTAKIILDLAGYTVDVAESGEEALQKYVLARDSGNPFEAVILDLTIVGGMGGIETIKHLIEIDPQVKGIIFSGYSNDPVIANYRQYGFKGALTKPATRSQMVEALKKLC